MNDITLPWSDFKTELSNRKLSILNYGIYSDQYYLIAHDTSLQFSCLIPMDDGADQVDFETNYKSTASSSPSSRVTTRFEERDKTLKICHGEATVGEDGTATVLIQVPGTPGSADGRWISSGIAFFDTFTPGDKILSVRFTDEDNILGYGAGFVVGSYTDDDANEDQRGWAIPPPGFVKAEAIGGYGFAPAGFYIKIIGKKGNSLTTGTLFMNIEWGKVEV